MFFAQTRINALRVTLVATLALALASPGLAVTSRYYVDVDAAGGDGSSWAQAFDDLQDALDAALDGDEIWVAEGTYIPSEPISRAASDATFVVPRGVHIYGGFDATETLATEADPATNRTILTGDVQQNDDSLATFGYTASFTDIKGQNSLHVVTISAGGASETLLRGMIITGGNADDGPPNNADEDGPAILCGSAELRLEQMVFVGHDAEGGTVLNNCPNIEVYDSVFRFNRSGESAVVSTDGGTWDGNVFENNEGGTNGAIFNVGGQTLTVTNSAFRYNTSDTGGVFIQEDGTSHLENVVFIGSSAPHGALSISGSADLDVVNGTFVGNFGENGDGIINVSSGDLLVANSIFWFNRDADDSDDPVNPVIFNPNTGTATVTHSLVQGSGGSSSWSMTNVTDGGSNIDPIDAGLVHIPAIEDVPFDAIDDPNVHLLPGSPALDAGDNSYVTTSVDIDGNPRIQGPARGTDIVDMGASEGVAEGVDVGITKTSTPTDVVAGDDVTYTIVVTNYEAFALEVLITDEFPEELACSWTLTPNSAGDGPVIEGDGDIAQFQTLSAGEHATITALCAIDSAASGDLSNTATVKVSGDVPYFANDTHPNSATEVDSITIVVELTLNQKNTSDTGADNEFTDQTEYWRELSILHVIEISNFGPSDDPAAQLVVDFSDELENCVEVQCTAARGSCPLAAGNILEREVYVPEGGTSLSVICEIKDDAPLGDITTTATVTASGGTTGDDTTNNGSEEIDTIIKSPLIFEDGFESGDTDAWSNTTG